MCRIKSFLADETGATAIEYGLIAGALALAIIGVISSLGTEIANTFARTTGPLQSAGAGGGN